MPWDGELEQLTLRAFDTFGEEACQGAIRRAMAVAINEQSQPLKGASPLAGDGTIVSTDGTVTPLDAYYEAVRLELRQLLREH